MLRKSSNLLNSLLVLDQNFRIGVSLNSISNEIKSKLNLTDVSIGDSIPIPILGPITKKNKKGIYSLVEPRSKTERRVFISYRRRKDNKLIEFYRNYLSNSKFLEFPLNEVITLEEDSEGEIFLVSDLLTFNAERTNEIRNTHIINMFLEIFRTYEILKDNLEYVIKKGETLEFEILPSGTILDDIEKELLIDKVTVHLKDSDKEKFIRKTNVLSEYSPTIRSSKVLGNGYIIYEYQNIVIAESIKAGHATYLFKNSGNQNYEDIVMRSKSEARNKEEFIQRIFHTDLSSWERKIRFFLNQQSN